jgi:hypothetical protein
MEKRTFLGVATGPVDLTMRVQLSIPRGTGLTIVHVDKDSPAGKALLEHDILMKFSDQILISHEQLAVLVENSKPGDSVTLTILRGGKEQTATVTLAEHEVPARPQGFPHMGGQPWMGPNAPWREAFDRGERQVREARERVEEHTKDMHRRMEPPRDGERDRGLPEGEGDRRGPGTVRTATWVENEVALNLVENARGRHLTVVDNGKEVFSGPVNSEEERGKIPETYQGVFRRLEAQLKPENSRIKDAPAAEERSIF